MDKMKLTEEQFKNLKTLLIPKEILNTESDIYQLSYQNHPKILKKIWTKDKNIYTSKIKTVELLNNYKNILPDSFCIPDSFATINKKIVGFIMPEIEGVNLKIILNSSNLTLKEKIAYLKKVGEVLEQLKNIRNKNLIKEIYLNDLHEGNIMVDRKTNKIYLIDLDSCKIDSNITLPSHYLTPVSLLNEINEKYRLEMPIMPGYIKPDENTDLYCYNIMLLNFMRGKNVNNVSTKEFNDLLNYMDIIKINVELLESFHKLLTKEKNINPYPFLNSLTESQLSKIRTKKL